MSVLGEKAGQRLRAIGEKYGGRLTFDDRLSARSTIRVGGTAPACFEPSGLEDLIEARRALEEEGVRAVVIGGGSNILFPDGVLNAVIIKLTGDIFRQSEFDGEKVSAGGGMRLGALISACCRRSLAGLEGLIGIPGTVGGAVMNNASYKAAISDNIAEVLALDAGNRLRQLELRDMDFRYRWSSFGRGDVIIKAVFRLDRSDPADLEKNLKALFVEKMGKQPLAERTLGCVFRNPESGGRSSGELIDECGLKGVSVGGARVSEKHANFIVNSGNASGADVRALMKKIRARVKDGFGVDLEPEIEVWD